MPCLLGCIALSFPRLVIILVVIFSDYLGQAYQTTLWPLLGFFFLPLTTLAYAWAWHNGAGHVQGFGLFVVVIAVIIDLGLAGGSAQGAEETRGRCHADLMQIVATDAGRRPILPPRHGA